MFIESLESRTLMSVSPIDTQVAADRLVVCADLLQFKSDVLSYTAKLLTDCAALKAADLKQDPTLAPLFTTLHTDVCQMRKELLADRLTECSNVLKDESAIVGVLANIVKDKGNPTEEAANKEQLLVDRVQLQEDEITGLNTRLATREADYTTVFSDLGAITTALTGDTGASPQLQAAVTKFVTDRTDALNAMTTDLSNLIAARTQLATDLAALEV